MQCKAKSLSSAPYKIDEKKRRTEKSERDAAADVDLERKLSFTRRRVQALRSLDV